MRLHILGVNGPYPASSGAASGYLLEAGPLLLQFDFGSGILSRLTAVCPPEDLDALFLSHWHFDHTSDLLPLIYRLEAAGKTVQVFAPPDDGSAVRAVVSRAGCFSLRDIHPGETVRIGGTAVRVGEARHPVPAVGFRAEYEGVSFGYTGDTNTLPSLADFYRDVDLLLADGLFPEAVWDERKPHLSAALAARLAAEAGAKRLILTHLNPVYAPELLLREARVRFPAACLAEAGKAVSL